MWRVIYPCGIHLLASQIVLYAAVYLLFFAGKDYSATQEFVVLLTGITGIAAMIPCLFFYRRDREARIFGGLIPETAGDLPIHEALLLLLMGGAFSQFINLIVGLLQNILDYQQYQESMEQITQGKSLLMLVFWMGIVAPAAEEVIFRWLIYLRLRDYMKMGAAAVVSGVFFGIYHMNLVQAVYAGILGIVFAYFLELSGSIWSSMFLHMGANIWSLLFSEIGLQLLEKNPVYILLIYVGFLCIMIFGIFYFQNKASVFSGRMN